MKESYYNLSVPYDSETLLMYNTLTGKLISMPQKKVLTVQEQDYLYREGFYVSDDNNEVLDINIRNILEGPSFLFLTILPTMKCNFRCIYCWETFKENDMKLETIDAILNLIDRNKKTLKFIEISWFGGEPLLRIDIIQQISFKITEICNNNNIHISYRLATNGYLLDKRNIDIIKAVGINNIVVTLDGPRKAHDTRRVLKNGAPTFSTILENIEQIDGIHIDLGINCDNSNIKYMDEFLEDILCIKNKVVLYYRFVFPPILDWNNYYNSKDYDLTNQIAHNILLQLNWKSVKKGFRIRNPLLQNRSFYCKSDMKNHLIIGPNREIYKCNVEFEQGNSYGILKPDGTIHLNQSYTTVWRNNNKQKKCEKCIFFPKCNGGCTYAYLLSQKNKCAIISIDEAKEYIKMKYYELKRGGDMS